LFQLVELNLLNNFILLAVIEFGLDIPALLKHDNFETIEIALDFISLVPTRIVVIVQQVGTILIKLSIIG